MNVFYTSSIHMGDLPYGLEYWLDGWVRGWYSNTEVSSPSWLAPLGFHIFMHLLAKASVQIIRLYVFHIDNEISISAR